MADRQQLYIAWCSNRIIYGINAGKPFTCVGTRLGNTLLSINVSRRFFFFEPFHAGQDIYSTKIIGPELIVIQLNINPGYNDDLLKKSGGNQVCIFS